MKKKKRDEEKKRRNLINYFLRKDPVLESNIEFEIKFKSGIESKKWDTNDERLQGAKERRWWKSKDNKILYNQQAHVIMNILSYEIPSKISFIPNIGYRLWFILASNDTKDSIIDNEILKSKIIEKLKDDNERKEFLKNNESNINFNNPGVIKLTIEKNLNLYDIVNNNFEHTSKENKLNLLLDYVELYFSKPSNFKTTNNKLDYLNFNEPILNNLYNWYLKDITNPDEINTYCNKLENIINSMEQLLTREKNTTIQKCNIICTIAKTKIIIHDLIKSQNNINKEQTQLKDIKNLVGKTDDCRTAANEFMKNYGESSH